MFFANSKAENQKSKTKKLKNQDFSHTRVCVREKAKKCAKLMILCTHNGAEYQKIRFKALFSLVERVFTLYLNSCPPR